MKMTRAQKKDRLLKYFLYFSILCLGVAIGIALRHYYNIPLIEAVNIVDVATLIVTIFLAVYIPGVFDRQLQVRQEKKELIESRIRDLQEFYRKINQVVQQESEPYKTAYAMENLLDVASNRLGIVEKLMNYLNLDTTFEEELVEVRRLNDKYRKIVVEAIRSGAEKIFSDEVQKEEETIYNKLDTATSILIFKISDI